MLYQQFIGTVMEKPWKHLSRVEGDQIDEGLSRIMTKYAAN
jgi:hypothetical protein